MRADISLAVGGPLLATFGIHSGVPLPIKVFPKCCRQPLIWERSCSLDAEGSPAASPVSGRAGGGASQPRPPPSAPQRRASPRPSPGPSRAQGRGARIAPPAEPRSAPCDPGGTGAEQLSIHASADHEGLRDESALTHAGELSPFSQCGVRSASWLLPAGVLLLDIFPLRHPHELPRGKQFLLPGSLCRQTTHTRKKALRESLPRLGGEGMKESSQ